MTSVFMFVSMDQASFKGLRSDVRYYWDSALGNPYVDLPLGIVSELGGGPGGVNLHALAPPDEYVRMHKSGHLGTKNLCKNVAAFLARKEMRRVFKLAKTHHI